MPAVREDVVVEREVGESPRDVAVTDVDHDGKPDVVVANGDVGNPTSAKNYVSVLMNGCTPPPRHRAVKH